MCLCFGRPGTRDVCPLPKTSQALLGKDLLAQVLAMPLQAGSVVVLLFYGKEKSDSSTFRLLARAHRMAGHARWRDLQRIAAWKAF